MRNQKEYYISDRNFMESSVSANNILRTYVSTKIDNIIAESYNRVMTEATSNETKEVV